MVIQGKQKGSPFSIGEGVDSSSVLTRGNSLLFSNALTSSQLQVDQLMTDFSKHATDWKSLAAMTVGGMAYRAGRMGVLSLGALRETPLLAQPLSVGLGLSAEVSAFEFTNRSLSSLSEGAGFNSPYSQNLWSFSGEGGWKEGLLSSLIAFGSLKGFGKLAESQNLILQHAAQDSGMVLGHQLVYQAGVGSRPEGSLAEQLMKAEVTNLQMSAGMSLGQGLMPKLVLNSSLTKSGESGRIFEAGLFSKALPDGELAWEGAGKNEPLRMPTWTMSQMGGGSGGGKKGGEPPVGVGRSGRTTISPKDPLIGQTIDGRYKVEAVIGSGGMGIVYRCKHVQLGTFVAIKVLRTSQAASPENTERFRNEAKAASSIGNPHIIGIKDIGQLPDGATYFVMEHLEGVPLAKIMEGDKPVPVPRLLSIARQIAVGLGAAHRKDIVHRDLKPSNIHLVPSSTEREFVKILDFGIAKMLNSDKTDLTIAGSLLGTPRYMSPEQARGVSIDHRSDIYSYGILLYKMATGKVPFDSDNLLSILEAHRTEEPTPIRDLDPPPQEVPPLLEDIILKCLSKNPAERYQSMEEVIADIDKVEAEIAPKAVVLVKPRPLQIPKVMPDRLPPIVTIPPAPAAVKTQGKEGAPKSRWPLYLALTGLGGGSVLVAALFASGRLKFPNTTSPTPTPAPTPAPTPPPPPTPTPSQGPQDAGEVSPPDASPTLPPPVPPPTSKKVELTVDPADAHVFQGTQELEKPLLIEIEPGKTVDLEIRREGYKTKKITLDESQEKISVHLEKEVKKVPHPPTPKPPLPDAGDEEPPFKTFEEP